MKIPDRSFEYAKHIVVSNIGNEIGFSSRISRTLSLNIVTFYSITHRFVN